MRLCAPVPAGPSGGSPGLLRQIADGNAARSPSDGRAVSHACEVDLGVVQITRDLVDVTGVDRGAGRSARNDCHRFALRYATR
jgi:hypothetical protein